MKMPEEFFECMKATLKDDYKEYIKHFDDIPYRGLRVNTLKTDIENVVDNIGFEMKKSPFFEKGFYISNELEGVGNHPFHHSGAIYLQEPSAMSAVTVLDVKPGDKVLDLCAAPGGKSTQIAAELCGEGLLWSNEINAKRAKILASNLERCGVKNSIVSNSTPQEIANELTCFFDKVLVDAPCSGEGMIRREVNAVTEWKLSNRQMCASRQLEILENACKCLKNNGEMVYSTCTLSGEENEMVIDEFLIAHPEFELIDINVNFGRKAYTYFTDNKNLSKCRRILLQDGGEGHFIAKLRKTADEFCLVKTGDYNDENKIFTEFYNDNFNDKPINISIRNNVVYLQPVGSPITKGLKIIKSGVKVGEIAKNRFIPSHELYMSKKPSDIKNVLRLSVDEDRAKDFLHGLETDCDLKGYCGVAVNGVITGFGKASNGRLKNHYPKGLRIL